MNQFFEVTAVSSDEEKLEKVARKYGVKHYCVPMTRKISPFKDLTSLWRMYHFLKREKPEIVHSHTPKAGIIGMVAAYFAGVPCRFHTVAGLPLLEAKGAKRKLLNLVETLTYYFATNVYPNSFDLEKIILQAKYCSQNKLKVIGQGSSNGIDTSYFDKNKISDIDQKNLKKQLGIGPDDFIFIFVGRLVGDKGINELVSAFKTLVEVRSQSKISSTDTDNLKYKNIDHSGIGNNVPENGHKTGESFYVGQSISGLHIRYRLGKIVYRTILRSEKLNISEMQNNSSNFLANFSSTLSHNLLTEKVDPKIKLLLVGPLEQKLDPVLGMTLSEMQNNRNIICTDYVQDVRPYLAISECLILPSYREGLPGSVLQAGAMNLPCIVSNINGCNEIITDGFNGLIVPVKNENALGSAMVKILDDDGVRLTLGGNSRPVIVEKYDHQKVWEGLLAEYRKN